jgi:hypothetical protein
MLGAVRQRHGQSRLEFDERGAMSVLTSVIVSVESSRPSTEERIVGDIQNWLADFHHMPFERMGSGFGTGGGEKSLTCSLLIGTFNFFETGEFSKWIARQSWFDELSECNQVELMVKEVDREDYARWKILWANRTGLTWEERER